MDKQEQINVLNNLDRKYNLTHSEKSCIAWAIARTYKAIEGDTSAAAAAYIEEDT